MSTLIQVQTTFAAAEDAVKVARILVAEKLAACCQTLPGLTSIYVWEGSLHEAAETLLLAKTTTDRWPELRDRLAQLHPYDTPEIIAIEVQYASFDYMTWVKEAVSL